MCRCGKATKYDNAQIQKWLRTIVVGGRKFITPIDIDSLLFAPSRLATIVAEIDAVAAAFANRKWRREYRKQMEEHGNG